ncbi:MULTISPECIES: hypothetical protein [unclassified Streptomyces]|uniref:hypothetical protein n=1 Tax=unclassified Streptomyces TaxID=2593676 RepID=UPI0036E5CCEC
MKVSANKRVIATQAARAPALTICAPAKGERLPYLLDRLHPAVTEGDREPIKTDDRLSEAYRRLYGLDAPKHHQLQVQKVAQGDLELQDMTHAAQAKTQLIKETRASTLAMGMKSSW